MTSCGDHHPPPGTVHLRAPCGAVIELSWMDAYTLGHGVAAAAIQAAVAIDADRGVFLGVARDARRQPTSFCWHIHDLDTSRRERHEEA